MNRLSSFLAMLLVPLATLSATPVAAQQTVMVTVEEWTEEWIDGEWVVVDHSGWEDADRPQSPAPAARAVASPMETVEAAAIAAYGPFRVLDDRTAAIVDVTDAASPRQFAALLAAYPDIEVLEFVEVPGTHDDRANFAVGRMIREYGIATSVPEGGSVRSGGVELFLAGVNLAIADNSEFAVHGWMDDRGMGAEDYPMSAPEHQRYLAYYAEMGMAPEAARAFYAMTNSVPFEDALWLTGEEMQVWMGVDSPAANGVEPAQPVLPSLAYEDVLPRLAYLDLAPAFQ